MTVKEQLQPPPIGLRPEWIYIENRVVEISVAITEYLGHGKEIPIEWIREYNKLVKFLKNRYTKLAASKTL